MTREAPPPEAGDEEMSPLSDEAYYAILVEHERDHTDGPGWPVEGCLGCRLLSAITELRAELAEAPKELLLGMPLRVEEYQGDRVVLSVSRADWERRWEAR